MVRNSPNEHAKDFKNEIKLGNDEENYISLPDKNNIYKWKKVSSNAIKHFKMITPQNKINKILKFDEKLINNTIKKLKKELMKFNIILIYLENMGRWYDGEYHFIDYLWSDGVNELKNEYKIVDEFKHSFMITDDIYVLNALQTGKLIFQHNILLKDVKHLKEVYKKIIGKELLNYSKNKVIQINFKT
jgi:hypothetical protein